MCTVVNPIGVLLKIPDWYPQLPFGDWTLYR
jgi:hypothetical protein